MACEICPTPEIYDGLCARVSGAAATYGEREGQAHEEALMDMRESPEEDRQIKIDEYAQRIGSLANTKDAFTAIIDQSGQLDCSEVPGVVFGACPRLMRLSSGLETMRKEDPRIDDAL